MASNAENIARWIFGLVGVANLTISIREWLTREDRDVLEILGSVVSLHSTYLASVVVSAIIVMACAFPALQWAWEMPARRQERQRAELEQKRKKYLEEKNEGIKNITELIELLSSFGYAMRSSVDKTNILILKASLINKGVVPDRYRHAPDAMWKTRLEGVLPYIVQYEVKQGVARYERDLEGQQEED